MKIPLKARWSLFRQGLILRARYAFSLDIDQIREQQQAAQIAQLRAVDDAALKTMQTMTGLLKQFEARLSFYEQNIPRMRMLKQQWDRAQLAGASYAISRAQADPEREQALNDGVLHVPPTNGKHPLDADSAAGHPV